VRIVLAEDSSLLREGLRRFLSEAGFDVVAAVATAPELLAAVEAHGPDVVVTDVRMPPGQLDEGLRAAIEIRAAHPRMGILVLSHYVESRQAVRLLEAGSDGVGYLLKDRVGDITELAEAVRRVAAGGSVIDAEVVSQLFGRRRTDDALERLSAREREILGLMAEGLSNRAIRERLFISPKTLERHIGSVFSKLDLPPNDDENRRVVAVLRYLRGEPQD
jgi:DNA-binding NarL/FixJ family response regulator